MKIQSSYFNKTPVQLKSDSLLSFSCIRNELPRLKYFLNYYRAKGVDHFFIVDNGSTDGSQEFLINKPDVTVFQTGSSYRGSLQEKYG